MKLRIIPLKEVLEDFTKIPQESGVYFFMDRRQKPIYIGKAQNLKKRLLNYFQKQKDLKVKNLMQEARHIGFMLLDSPMEALIEEAELIKKFQPKFNKAWKDDKKYFYVAFDKSRFPRLYLTHRPADNIDVIGPFTSGASLKQTLKKIRKVYPYCTCLKSHKRICLNHEIGLCPGWCCSDLITEPKEAGKIYKRNLKAAKMILRGQSDILKKELIGIVKIFEKQNNQKAKEIILRELESVRNITAHKEVVDEYKADKKTEVLRKLKDILGLKALPKRIEVYDISNYAGKEAVGSMTVFVNAEISKKDFRKFKIKSTGTRDDPGMIKEVIERRLNHQEWPTPDIILIDGGITQFNAAKKVTSGKDINVISLAKPNKVLYFDDKKTVKLSELPDNLANFIIRLDKSAHDFAIRYHKKLRRKNLLSG